jgi:hypothetical protein
VVDLLTGEPTHVVVEDVSVWEPYKGYGGERKRRTAWARRIEADLTLHELIPWNRLGVPEAIEIPWLLHLSDVRSTDDAWFVVREYEDTPAAGGEPRTLLSLIDAFRAVEPVDPDRRGISFRIERARLARASLDVDFIPEAADVPQGWRVADVGLRDLAFELRYDAPGPAQGLGVALPLRFDLETRATEGTFVLDDIEVPFTDFTIAQLACGTDDTPLGDVRFAGEGLAAGSPLELRGILGDAFTRLPTPSEPLPLDAAVTYGARAHVRLAAGSADPYALAGHLELQLGLAPGTIDAEQGTVWASVEGPLAEPRYHLAAEGLSLDLMGEPAWTLDDVQLSVDIEASPVPDRFHERVPDDDLRLVARFDRFEGSALAGAFALDSHADEPAFVVFPEGDEPWLIAAPLALDGIDPAQWSPDDPELAATLAGQATGRVDLHQLVLGTPTPDPAAPPGAVGAEDDLGLLLAELRLDDVRVARDRGPAVDGIPRRLRADGTVIVREDGSIDAEALVLRTDGTELDVTGGVDGKLAALDPTALRLRIDDGQAFARAFDLPPYFDALRAELDVDGSTTAPSARAGSLWLSGVGVQGGTATEARLSMDRGVLHVVAPRAELFGGTGSVEAHVSLFDRTGLASDPRLRATIDMHDVELAELLGGDAGLSGRADVRLDIGDARGGALPLSKLEVTGEVRVPDLRMAGTRYRDAVVEFALDDDRVTLKKLVLPVHRTVSPFYAGKAVSVPVGKIVAKGTIGLEDDPTLALVVTVTDASDEDELDPEATATEAAATPTAAAPGTTTEGVPLRLVARLLGLQEVPVRGKIVAGTSLAVKGSLRRPSVNGSIHLSGLSAQGVALGSGLLEVTSEDVGEQGPLAAHRELRVDGELSTGSERADGIRWTIDAVVALGEVPRGKAPSRMPPFDAEVDVRFARVSLDTLLRGLSRGTGQAPTLTGRLEELGAHVVTCDPHASMISTCHDAKESRREQSLEVSLQLASAWVGGREPTTADPCQDPTILCAPEQIGDVDNRLQATIDWPKIVLDRPWRWRTGGLAPAELELRGDLDLSASASPTDAPATAAAGDCAPPHADRLRPRVTAEGAARAEVRGALDLAVLAELLGSDALRRARGRLKVNLALLGPAADTTISGSVTLPAAPATGGDAERIVLDVGELGFPVEVDALDLRVDDHWLVAQGQLRVLGEALRFGSVGNANTGFAFGGACEGHYGLAVDGTVGARIINELAGEGTATKGGVDVSRLVARGNVDADDPLEQVEGTLELGSTSLVLDVDEGLPPVELTAGSVDFVRCRGDRCPPEVEEGSIALYVGGRDGAKSEQRPGRALRAKVGPRGDAFAWGTTYVAQSLTSVADTRLVVELEDVPYRGYDQRGRPVYEAELSSSAITFQGGLPLVVSGTVDVDRARYVQDAVQGVEILRFTDDVDLPSAPPPELVRALQLDLRVQTSAPLRVENNVAHGVEASAVVEVTGTYDAPEFAGRVEVEPGGTVDIPFLTGTYEIQRGRVTLVRELEDAEVDVLALRRELVYIEDQPRQIYLLLGGTADAITWKCIAEGDTSGAVETQRGCLDYLVLGAGDVQSSTLTVQRTGGGGLANARKPLQVVGHVTEFDFGKRIEEAAPRLSPYVPDIRLRLGQIGPELEVTTPEEWLDFDYAHGTLGLDYTRGYPGFLLQQSRELTFELQAIDRLVFEVSRDIRSYLNNRIIFDPLRQTTVEFRVDFEIPSLR